MKKECCLNLRKIGMIRIKLGCSIDYEDDKEEYEFNESGEAILMYGSFDWEQTKSIGFDRLSLKFADAKKEFIDLESAYL